MYDFIYDELTPAQLDAYLLRIGCPGSHPVTKATLDQLVCAHQSSVPFESLDVQAGAPFIALDRDSLFDKLITRRRGGFCFELNGGFVMLLRAMGFDAYSVMCRVAARRTDLGNLTHRATVVRLDGRRYLCDVGLGGPMAPFAVELSPEHQSVFSETYWIEPTEEGWFIEYRLSADNASAPVIIFAPQPFLQKDFEPLCQALLSNPDSLFRKNRMANLRTTNGYLNLLNSVLSITENGQKREISVSDEQYPQILRDYFGIVI